MKKLSILIEALKFIREEVSLLFLTSCYESLSRRDVFGVWPVRKVLSRLSDIKSERLFLWNQSFLIIDFTSMRREY